ncbi:MAG: short-chain dehydrogenase [Porticoccaceae bacterium]|nr:MAG: short-chain dehydrogenase [Porticoccaceae bacterium]
MPEIRFDDQVVAITGAGGGLGRAYALAFAARGAKVVVNDLSGAEQVAEEIRAAGGEALACPQSVATPEGGAAIVEAALARWGRLDALVHNAGVWRHRSFAEMEAAELDPVLDVHLRGAFFVGRPAWRAMAARGYGRIVLTGSSTGAFGRLLGSNYAAAKAAMFGLARALALEGEALGIRTNCILPIAPFGRHEGVPESLTAAVRATGLAPEDAVPELVTPMVLYLASRACAVNGEAFSAGGRRFGRVFVAVADGWLAPDGPPPAPEEVAAHLPEIRDLSRFRIPEHALAELADIGERLRARRGEGR